MQLNGYSQFHWAPMRRHCGTWPRETGWKPPAWVAKIAIHSDLTPQTTSLTFASQLAWAFDSHEPLLTPLNREDHVEE